MSRGVQPSIIESLVERYKEQAEAMAQECVKAGLSDNELKDASKFAEFEALRPTAIIDWFKRRATRNVKWNQVVTPAFLHQLMEVREWAQAQDENVQEQTQIVCSYVDLIVAISIYHLRAEYADALRKLKWD